MPSPLVAFAAVFSTLLTLGAPAASAPTTTAPTPWIADAAFPTNMAWAPDGRLFYTEKATGLVRVVAADGTLLPQPFARFDVGSDGETGLLGIALDPGFGHGRDLVYLYLSDAASGRNELVRLTAVGDTGSDERTLATFLPTAGLYHNGGDLSFGRDGRLYVTVGEAHDAGRAQRVDDVGGKVLRLDTDGTAAPGNPFGDANPAYTYGHRNSFGICVDPSSGELWETENGPDVDDEVNRLVPGANYGWPVVTGDSGGRFEDPVAVFADTVALTGCAWWDGRLYVGSFNDGLVRRIDTRTGAATTVAAFPTGVTDLQTGPDGDLYVATMTAIWRLGPGASGAPATTAPATAGSNPASPWIPVAAAVVLAAALAARIRAGRRLRRDGATRD